MSGIIGGTGSKSGVLGQTGSGWIKVWGKEITSDSGSSSLNVASTVTTAGTVFTNRFDRYMIVISHFSCTASTDPSFYQYIDGSKVTSSVRRCQMYNYSNTSDDPAVNNSDSVVAVPFCMQTGDDAGKGCDVEMYVDRPWSGHEKRIWGRSSGYTGVENRLISTFFDAGSNSTGVFTGLELVGGSNIDHAIIGVYGLSRH